MVHRCSYRPTDDSNQPPGRGVLSMHGLTYGVIRVDSEEKLSVLTVQDVGLVMPGGEWGPAAPGLDQGWPTYQCSPKGTTASGGSSGHAA